jgi:hypothetical protein
MATRVPWYSPLQMSVDPPDTTAMLPRFSSAVESTAEVGSRPVALHTFPKAATNLAFFGETDGYAFAGTMRR